MKKNKNKNKPPLYYVPDFSNSELFNNKEDSKSKNNKKENSKPSPREMSNSRSSRRGGVTEEKTTFQELLETPIVRPNDLHLVHFGTSFLLSFGGAWLYWDASSKKVDLENMDDFSLPFVLMANMSLMAFTSLVNFRDYYMQKKIQSDKFTTENCGTSILKWVGATAAAFPYAAQALATSGSEPQFEKIIKAVSTLISNTQMNLLAMRAILANPKIQMLLFPYFVLPYKFFTYIEEKYFISQASEIRKINREMEKEYNLLRSSVVETLRRARGNLLILSDDKISSAFEQLTKSRPNSSFETGFTPALRILLEEPESIDTDDTENLPTQSVYRSTKLTSCRQSFGVGFLKHSYFHNVILVVSLMTTVIFSISDCIYIKEMGDDMGGGFVLSIFLIYLGMSNALVLGTDFCNEVLSGGTDFIGDVVAPGPIADFGWRHYFIPKLVSTIILEFIAVFSVTVGVEIYSEKMTGAWADEHFGSSWDVLYLICVEVTRVGFTLFNARSLLGLAEDVIQNFAYSKGAKVKQECAKLLDHFSQLIWKFERLQGSEILEGLSALESKDRNLWLSTLTIDDSKYPTVKSSTDEIDEDGDEGEEKDIATTPYGKISRKIKELGEKKPVHLISSKKNCFDHVTSCLARLFNCNSESKITLPALIIEGGAPERTNYQSLTS